MISSSLPVIIVSVLIISAYIIPLFKRCRPEISGRIVMFCFLTVLILSGYMVYLTAQGYTITYHAGGWRPPFGIEIKVGTLEALLTLTICFIGALVSFWSYTGLRAEVHHKGQAFFYALFLLTAAGMIGMISASDLFNMYVFLEVTSIGACAIVAARSNRQSTSAAFKYLLLSGMGSALVLFAIGLIYMVTGVLNYDHISLQLVAGWRWYPRLLWVACSFFFVGLGIKSALFPLHIWLPDAHSSAPTPASAVLSALVVKAYALTLIKLLYVLMSGIGPGMTWDIARSAIILLSILAIIAGSVFCLVQHKIKRLLAYSTVAQMGYIFFGLGLDSNLAVTAAMFHLFIHALMKSTLFLAAGTIAIRTGAKDIADYTGMGKRMPVSMAAFTIAALSMIGLPGFAGFISKYYLAAGSLHAGFSAGTAIMVVSGLLNACYYLPILERAYFQTTDLPTIRGGKIMMVTPALILAVLCIVFGLYPGLLLNIIDTGIASLLWR